MLEILILAIVSLIQKEEHKKAVVCAYLSWACLYEIFYSSFKPDNRSQEGERSRQVLITGGVKLTCISSNSVVTMNSHLYL
jgi:hypothetical protein